MRAHGSVRTAYHEIRSRRDVHVADELLDAVQPIADEIKKRHDDNRRLLSVRGLLSGIEYERVGLR